MKITKLTKYGNSMGVRIPKAMLEESGLSGEVKIEAHEGRIVISRPRQKEELQQAAIATRHLIKRYKSDLDALADV